MLTMALREIAVVLDDQLIKKIDALAKELGVDRSEIMRRGVGAILDADALRKADRKLQDSYLSITQDEAIIEAAARFARENSPLW